MLKFLQGVYVYKLSDRADREGNSLNVKTKATEFSINVLTEFAEFMKKIFFYYSKRIQTCHLLC